MSIVKVVGSSTEVQIGNEVALPLTYTAGQLYTIRFKVTGTNPTTLQAKAWVAGSSEPAAWNVSVTDSQAELQTSGAIGVRASLGSSATTMPTYLFDNLNITNLG